MTNLIGKSLGRYHILEQLGEGGMAIVYKAYDTHLERDVAIKVIRNDAFPPNQLERILKRFEREAKALAKLSHPNIVKIHDYGKHEGAPYLVMEYLPGGNLKARLGKPIAWQEAVKTLLPIAEALEYAHENKIIHRDIKPSNILLTEKGAPMLTDFGIAKILESEAETATLTGTGIGVGTPEYMAPEQWTGQTSPQSDIYSLGVVLYEMVTGRKPYEADTPAAILLKQANDPLVRPSTFIHGLPGDFEKLLIKMLTNDLRNRYKDNKELLPVLVQLSNTTSRRTSQNIKKEGEQQNITQKQIRGRRTSNARWLFFIIGGAALLSLVGFFIRDRKITTTTPSNTKTPSSVSSPTSIAATKTAISPAIEKTNSPEIVPTTTVMPTPVNAQAISVSNANQITELRRVGLGAINQSAWATDINNLIIATTTGLYRIDPLNGNVLLKIDTLMNETLVATSANANIIASASPENAGEIKIWDGQTGKLITTLEMGYPVEKIAISKDGKKLAGAWNEPIKSRIKNGKIFVWNIESGQLIHEFTAGARLLQFSPDGNLLVSGNGNNDTGIKIWDLLKGKIKSTIPVGQPDGLEKFEIGSDSNHLAWFYYDVDWRATNKRDKCGCVVFENSTEQYFRIWDIEKYQTIANLKAGSEFVFLDTNNEIIYSSTEYDENQKKTTSFWSVDATNNQPKKLTSIDGDVTNFMVASSSNEIYYIQSIAGSVSVGSINIATSELATHFVGEELSNINSLAISPDGKLLAAGGIKLAKIWDIHSENGLVYQMPKDSSSQYYSITSLDFNSSSDTLAVGTIGGDFVMWDFLENSTQNLTISPSQYGPLLDIDFNGDNSLVALSGFHTLEPGTGEIIGGKGLIVDIQSMSIIDTFRSNGLIRTAKFQDDQPTLILGTGFPDNAIHFWSQNSEEPSSLNYRLDNLATNASLTSLAISPHGQYILAGFATQDGLYINENSAGLWQLWNLKEKQLVSTSITTGGILTVAFSPDGDLFALAGLDRSITLWDVNTSMLINTLQGHSDTISKLVFSLDGTNLFSASLDGTIRIWGIKQ